MKFKILFAAVLIFSAGAFAQEIAKPKLAYPFEDEIKAFKAKDSVEMPKPGGILFIGSSSIRKWTDLPAKHPNKPIIMRGVGGSKISQWVDYYMPSVVFPYKPSKIFIYVGDNDLAAGATSADVYGSFVKLLGMIREQLPNAKVYFMGMKLSPSRAKYYSEVALADMRIAAYIKTQKNVEFIDVNTTLLTPNALPDSALFQKDMLHLNQSGNDKWDKVITPYL